tara:strand:- start:571 stop:993 length:423 start_codon:yes stop_codon:yes gene_type:complete
MFVGTTAQKPALDEVLKTAAEENCQVDALDVAGARRIVPVLNPEMFEQAIFEPKSTDIDVHALHGGFLKVFAGRGGEIICDAEVKGMQWADGAWHVETKVGSFAAPIVVNAAGAWGGRYCCARGCASDGTDPETAHSNSV